VKRDFRLLFPAAGIWCGAFFQSLLFGVNGKYQTLLLSVILVLSWVSRRRLLSIFLVASLVGAVALSLHQSALQRDFFSERVGEVVTASLRVSSDVREIHGQVRGDFRLGDRYLVEVRSSSIDGIAIKVPLLLYGDIELKDRIPGERIEVLARIEVFPGYSNVAASLTQVGEIQSIASASWIWRWSSSIRRDINASLASLPSDARALIPGLVIGDRSGQSPELTAAMRRSGLTHLTAVSGANFAIVAALLLVVGRRLRIRGRALWMGIGGFLLLFIFLVRPSSSVLRAAVMTGVLLFAKSQGIRSSPIPALASAIGLLLLINPFYVRDAGFALSVFATSGLLFLAPAIEKHLTARGLPDLLAQALAIPIAATTFCLPIVVLLSGELSVISILANLLVAPVIAVITVCGVALMVLSPLSTSVGALIGWAITPFALWITMIARFLSALPFAALKWPQSWIGSLATLLVVALILFILKSRKRLLILVPITLLLSQVALTFSPFVYGWIPRDWQIFQCDVGQGDGLVIKSTTNRAIVIDVGPDPRAIDRCLRLLRITQIDLLVLTHFHADHVSGLSGALRGRVVDGVWVSPMEEPEEEESRVRELLGSIPTRTPRVGERFLTTDIAMQVIAVSEDTSPNDSSISILANVRGVTLFAAGDLEREGQNRALNTLRRLPPSALWERTPIDLMKGIHHGSALQDPELIALLRPRVSIFSVGSDNPYGHPSPSALGLYSKYGAVYRTDRDRSLALAKRGGNLVVVAAPPTLWAE
jgi:competence protein ComEC